MLQHKLTKHTACQSITDVLDEIDCRLTYFAQNNLKNISFDVSSHHPNEVIELLLFYKHVLKQRLFNPSYACGFDLNAIISRAKTLTHK